MKKRNSCDGCGILLEPDAKYCKYCGAERKEVPDNFAEEDGIQASATKRIRYCKYCGRRYEKNAKQCNCEEKMAEDTVVEEKTEVAEAESVEPAKLICEPKDEVTKYEEPECQQPKREEWEYKEPESEKLKLEETEREEQRYKETEYQELKYEESDYDEDSLPQKKPTGKAVKIAVAFLMLGAAGAAGFFLLNDHGNEYEQNTMAQNEQHDIKTGDNGSEQLATIAGLIEAEETIEILKSEISGDISTVDAESEHAENEAERARQESERAESEAERARQESERAESEAERARQESERAESEAEQARQESERVRLESERAELAAEIERMEAELEAKKLEQETTETPLYGYEGSYVLDYDPVYSNMISELYLEDDTDREISHSAILYVDEAKEKNGTKLGHTVYGGLEGWIDLSNYSRISYEDYSISEFTFCFAGGYEFGGIPLYTENDTSSELINIIPYGTDLIIINQKNGMGYTYYSGQRGWVLIDDVLSYNDNMAYQPASETGEIQLLMYPNSEADVLEIAYNEEKLLIDDWQNGWAKTASCGTTGWVCMAELKPAGDAEFVDFAVLEMPDDEVTVWGNTTFYEDGTPVFDTDYILPDSASRYLTEEDLERLTLKGICYAKNEIYARHGRIFKSQELKEYFEGQWWYNGIYEPSDSNDAKIVSAMNDYESYNKDLLWKVEQQRGIYELDQ